MTFATAYLLPIAITIPAAFAFERKAYRGIVTRTIARIRLVDKNAYNHLFRSQPAPAYDYPGGRLVRQCVETAVLGGRDFDGHDPVRLDMSDERPGGLDESW